MIGQEGFDGAGVKLAIHSGGIGDGVHGEELQDDRDVAKGQVEIDDAGGLLEVCREAGGEVCRQRGLTDSTLGGEDGDELAVGRAALQLL